MTTPKPAPSTRTPGNARLLASIHTTLYRLTGGLLGSSTGAIQFLLLTTTGRKTGKPRTQPLGYFHASELLYVVASNWGSDKAPAWYLNILANPTVRVQIKRRIYSAQARPATPEERANIWPQLVAHAPRYATYQAGTTREIPIVLLREEG
ncbi:MAG: nitroreductase family deazaflavin-dependent oxidoreductase [Ktedonobacterales bacterium]